jgi:hypothetical protein
MLSTDKLVLNMAAETITRNLKRVASKTRSLKSLEKSQYSRNSSIRSVASIIEEEFHSPPPPVAAQHTTVDYKFTPQGDHLLFSILDLTVSDVPNVAWKENNNLYLLIENQSWLYKTDILYEAGKKGVWKGKIADLDLVVKGKSPRSSTTLKFFVYHSCWAIQDKLIGICEIPITQFDASLPEAFDVQSYSTKLYDSSNVIKRRMCGDLSFQWKFFYGEKPTEANLSPRISEPVVDTGRLSTKLDNMDATSIVSKYVDLKENSSKNVNGFSPEQLAQAGSLLNDWEEGKIPKLQYQATMEPKPPKVPKIPMEELRESSSSEEKKNKKYKKISEALQKSKDLPADIATPHSLISNITEEYNKTNLPQEEYSSSSVNNPGKKEGNIRKSLFIRKERKPSFVETSASSSSGIPIQNLVKTLPGTSSIQEKFKIEHPVQYMFDQAFYFSLLKLATNFTLSFKELIILLDSLDIPLAESYQHYLLPASEDFEESNFMKKKGRLNKDGLRQNEEEKEIFSFPINHPSALAACLIDILTTKYPNVVDSSASSTINEFFTPKKLVQCINNLVQLLKQDYVNIRGMIFLGCAGKAAKGEDEQKATVNSSNPIHQSVGEKPTRKKSFVKTSSNPQDSLTLNESITKKPSQFSSSVMKSIILSMNLFSDLNDLPVILDGLTGKDFLTLSSAELKKKLKIKSSILLSRLLLYQSTLNVIDSCWDRGIRPQDAPLSLSSSSSSVAAATTTKSNNQSSGHQNLLKSLSRQVFEKIRSVEMNNSTQLSNNNNNNSNQENNSTIQSQKSVNKNNLAEQSLSQTIYLIQESNKLFQSYLSFNRAFAWNFNINFFTILANTIAGLYCYPVSDLSQLAVNELNDLYQESNSQNNNSTKSKNISTDLVWISIIFPSDEIYHQLLSTIKSLSDQHHHQQQQQQQNMNSSVIPAHVYQILEVHSNTNEIFINVPKSCLEKMMTQKPKNKFVEEMNHSSRKLNSSNSNTLNELYQLFYTINHNVIPMNQICVGMKAKIVSFQVLQRLVHSTYDWWDRPNDEILQKLANKTCEIISINELYSEKKRIGIKLLNTNISDALPYDALLVCEDIEEKKADENKLRKKSKKFSQSSDEFQQIMKSVNVDIAVVRKHQEDIEGEQDEEEKERIRLKRVKKLRKLLLKKKKLAEEEEALKKNETENKDPALVLSVTPDRKEINDCKAQVDETSTVPRKKSLKSASYDANIAPSTRMKAKPVIQQVQQQLPDPKMMQNDLSIQNQSQIYNDLFLQIPGGGDEALPDDNHNNHVEGKGGEDGNLSTPFRVYVETRQKEKTRKEQEAKPKKKILPYNVLLPEDKDYSWLKPPSPSQKKDLLVLENIEDLPSPREQQQQVQHPNLRQAEFDIDHAQYHPGVYKYAAPQEENNKDRGSKRPKSAGGTVNKKTSNSNQQHDGEEGDKLPKNVPNQPGNSSLHFTVSGLGYDEEGHSKNINDKMSPTHSPSRPATSPTSNARNARPSSANNVKYSTNRVIKNTQKYFENQEKEQENELKTFQNHQLNVQNLELSIAGNIVQQPPEKPSNSSKTKTKPTSKNLTKKDKILNSEGEDIVPDTEAEGKEEEEAVKPNFQVKVQKSPPVSPKNRKHQSLKEALLYEREMMKNQKEWDKKETYILKELKKLGIDTSKIEV